MGFLFCIKLFYFLQVEGLKININGNISSLPSSIAKLKTSLANGEYAEKDASGPTASKPGPMLLKQAITAERLDSTEKLFPIDITIKLIIIIIT